MIIRFDPDFVEILKGVSVRVWKGYRSIDITGNWRAIYAEKVEGKDIVAYFVALGTHRELYK